MAAEVYVTGDVSVFGNKRVYNGVLTASGLASGAANLGIGKIDTCLINPKSCSTYGSQIIAINTMSAGTAAEGWIRAQNVVAGDDFYIYAAGRS